MNIATMNDEVLDEEPLLPVQNPGTANNNERTGDRDLYFSYVMRQPKSPSDHLRSCDHDALPDKEPSIICRNCGIPALWFEVTRSDEYKATWYTERQANKWGIGAFLIRHKGRIGKYLDGRDRTPSPTFEVTRLSDGKQKNFDGEQAFIQWMEQKFEQHYAKCRLTPVSNR